MGKRLIIRCFYTNFPSKFGILNHKRFCNNYFIRIIGGVIEPDLVIPHPAMQQYFPSVTCSKFYLYSHIYTLPINPKSRICGSQLKIYNRNFGYLQKRRIFSHQTIFLNSFFYHTSWQTGDIIAAIARSGSVFRQRRDFQQGVVELCFTVFL